MIETSNCVIFTIEVFFFLKKKTKTDLSFNLSGQYVLSGGEEDEWQWSEHRSSLACVLQSTLSLSFGAAIKRHLSFEQRRSDNLSLSLSLSLSHVNEINMWSLFFEWKNEWSLRINCTRWGGFVFWVIYTHTKKHLAYNNF